MQVVNSSGVYNETYYYDSRDLVAMKDNSGEMFYYHPDQVQEIIDHTAAKVLDLLNIEHELIQRWGKHESANKPSVDS